MSRKLRGIDKRGKLVWLPQNKGLNDRNKESRERYLEARNKK
jgi:hypothetical protein